ncbi:hypothetical protein LJR230_002866 [Trinickia sp. LjRoot230]|uniref:hypothetical protein n=1 Tax=Trinickia sp. LjRoot230 TaxID=3342288 RepID=UPI003ECF5986
MKLNGLARRLVGRADDGGGANNRADEQRKEGSERPSIGAALARLVFRNERGPDAPACKATFRAARPAAEPVVYPGPSGVKLELLPPYFDNPTEFKRQAFGEGPSDKPISIPGRIPDVTAQWTADIRRQPVYTNLYDGPFIPRVMIPPSDRPMRPGSIDDCLDALPERRPLFIDFARMIDRTIDELKGRDLPASGVAISARRVPVLSNELTQCLQKMADELQVPVAVRADMAFLPDPFVVRPTK